MRGAKNHLLGGSPRLHEGVDRPPARLRIVPQEPSGMAWQSYFRHLRGAFAHRRGELPVDETGTGTNRRADRRRVRQRAMDAVDLPIPKPFLRRDRGIVSKL